MHSSFLRHSLSLVALIGLLSGCAQQTGTVTRAAASYLVFLGDTSDATVVVDDRAFALTSDNAKNHFELAPGVHRLKVERHGRVVVDREILLSDRQTVEVSIP